MLEKRARVYLLIVNTPTQCVIGGERGRVLAFVKEIGASFHEVHDVTTVHCDVVREVEKAYRELHLVGENRYGGGDFL